MAAGISVPNNCVSPEVLNTVFGVIIQPVITHPPVCHHYKIGVVIILSIIMGIFNGNPRVVTGRIFTVQIHGFIANDRMGFNK